MSGGPVWGYPRSAQRRVERSRRRAEPLTEERVKIAACEIALDTNHANDYSRLAELQERFPTDDPQDMAAVEFWLMWAVRICEDPALGREACEQVRDHHANALRLQRSYRR